MVEVYLARAVLSAIMLLDHSSADEIEPDVAAQGLENIAANLNLMNDDEREEFKRILGRLVETEPDYGPYVAELPHYLGWDVFP